MKKNLGCDAAVGKSRQCADSKISGKMTFPTTFQQCFIFIFFIAVHEFDLMSLISFFKCFHGLSSFVITFSKLKLVKDDAIFCSNNVF
jgi:hypothetical protein